MILRRLGKINVSEKEYNFNYSNFGYATLGLILEKVYETEYTDLINGYIQGELQLKNTYISDGSGDLGNMWDWMAGDAYMSAGALVSNVEDMMKYASLQLNNEICSGECLTILKNINASSKQFERLGIRMDAIAYGWIHDTKSGTVWHNGGTGNYNCYIGFDVGKQVAVVVLSNRSPNYRIPATVLGVKIMNDLKNETVDCSPVLKN